MFWEWLERTFYGIVAIFFIIAVVVAIIAVGALWLILYQVVAWLAILVLIIFVGVPIVTLIYTIYDNWFLVTEFFESLKEKWDNWGKKNV